jgi:flagellar biosynthesis chaperone FliJ
MKNMEEWFAAQNFNKEAPPIGHRNRFLEKLDKAREQDKSTQEPTKIDDINGKTPQKGRVLLMNICIKWSLVAGLAFLIGISTFNFLTSMNESEGLESVSQEMAQAQDFFTSTINLELERLDKAQSPQTERIIADTKKGLNMLENEYIQIKKDFKINNNNKAVIAAMIQNFQNRIDLLENALAHIEQLNRLKEKGHENVL